MSKIVKNRNDNLWRSAFHDVFRHYIRIYLYLIFRNRSTGPLRHVAHRSFNRALTPGGTSLSVKILLLSAGGPLLEGSQYSEWLLPMIKLIRFLARRDLV